ncbi:MAG: hypothetical protein EXR00_02250 [Alphaproteobacteria bacterium]|nr:hypothetical protein [Alphaproteobacteria bacterium]
MLQLTEKRFVDYFREQGETGMGYWIVTVCLKDGREFPQTVVTGGWVSSVRGYENIPFSEPDIDYFKVTHEKRPGKILRNKL